MGHFVTLSDQLFTQEFHKDVDDIRGSAVYGVDNDKLGKIDDVIFEHSTGEIRSVVVDTGGWLRSKKFIVPADRVHVFENDRDAFQVDLLKQHVERFPVYDEKHLSSQKDWADYENRYSKAWHDGEVLHKHGSNRTITPEPGEIGGGTDLARGRTVPMVQTSVPPTGFGSLGEEIQPLEEDDVERDLGGADATPHRITDKFTDTAPGSAKLNVHPASAREESSNQQYATGNQNLPGQQSNPSQQVEAGSGVLDVNRGGREDLWQRRQGINRGERWDRFEDLLRKNRVDVTAKCPSCRTVKDRAA